MGTENREQNRVSLHRTDTRAVPSVVTGHFCTLPAEDKTCLPHIALHPYHESSPHRARGSRRNLESACSSKPRVLAAKFEGRPRASVSRDLGRGSLTRTVFFFPIGNDLLFCIAKKLIQKWVRPQRPKRDLETQTTYWSSHLAARTLR